MKRFIRHFFASASLVRLIVSGSVLAVGLWLTSAAAQAATTAPNNPIGERTRLSRSIGSPMHRVDNILPPASSIAASAQLQPGGAPPSTLDGLSGSVGQRGENVPPRIPRVAGDENWSGKFALPGANNYVNAVAVDAGGTLYAGGIFTAMGGISASYVAKWSESGSWAALGTGVNSYIDALLVDSFGNLYAGGSFTTAGGTTVNRIAKWNGTSWSALGNGLNDAVMALAIDGSGNLYAGGWFTQICGNAACNSGNTAANYIAKWNGSSWSALSTGMNNYVWSLVVYGSNVYAGGDFTTAGGVSANSVAMWNGSSWSALGYGLNSTVFALAVDGSGNLYAGGAFTLKCSNAACSSGTAANRIQKWNGSSWSGLGSASMNGDVYTLKVDASGNLYVGGDFSYGSIHYIAKYNGSWSNVGNMDWDVLGLAIDGAGNLYAGGYFATVGAKSVNYVAKWNGSVWYELGYGVNNYVKALAADGNGNIYAGGTFTMTGGINANRIAKWDGSSWSTLGSGIDDEVKALVVDGGGNLYAGGYFMMAGGTTVNHIAKWNGSNWSALGSGLNFPVYALALDSNGNLFASGQFLWSGLTTLNHVAKWNGSSWSALGHGVSSNVNALAVGNGTLYAGGDFTQVCGNDDCNNGNTVVNHIAQWDGAAWSPVGSGVNNVVYALATDTNGNMYAGGYFSATCGDASCSTGNTSVNYIARWQANNWHTMGAGVTGASPGVYALTTDDSGSLFAGGHFSTAGAQSASNVAKWSGNDWSALGSGVGNYFILALRANGNKLSVGGGFATAGSKSSSNIAQWTVAASPPPPPPGFKVFVPFIVR